MLGRERASWQCGLARRKRGAGNVVSCARERAPQVILGIGMTSRKLRTGQTENGFHLRGGRTLQEQLCGDPQVRDTPIGPRKTLRNLETVPPGLIDATASAGASVLLTDMLEGGAARWKVCVSGDTRDTLTYVPYRRALRQSGSLHQGAAVGGQARGGVLKLHPGRQSAGQALLRFLIGESCR